MSNPLFSTPLLGAQQGAVGTSPGPNTWPHTVPSSAVQQVAQEALSRLQLGTSPISPSATNSPDISASSTPPDSPEAPITNLVTTWLSCPVRTRNELLSKSSEEEHRQCFKHLNPEARDAFFKLLPKKEQIQLLPLLSCDERKKFFLSIPEKERNEFLLSIDGEQRGKFLLFLKDCKGFFVWLKEKKTLSEGLRGEILSSFPEKDYERFFSSLSTEGGVAFLRSLTGEKRSRFLQSLKKSWISSHGHDFFKLLTDTERGDFLSFFSRKDRDELFLKLEAGGRDRFLKSSGMSIEAVAGFLNRLSVEECGEFLQSLLPNRLSAFLRAFPKAKFLLALTEEARVKHFPLLSCEERIEFLFSLDEKDCVGFFAQLSSVDRSGFFLSLPVGGRDEFLRSFPKEEYGNYYKLLVDQERVDFLNPLTAEERGKVLATATIAREVVLKNEQDFHTENSLPLLKQRGWQGNWNISQEGNGIKVEYSPEKNRNGNVYPTLHDKFNAITLYLNRYLQQNKSLCDCKIIVREYKNTKGGGFYKTFVIQKKDGSEVNQGLVLKLQANLYQTMSHCIKQDGEEKVKALSNSVRSGLLPDNDQLWPVTVEGPPAALSLMHGELQQWDSVYSALPLTPEDKRELEAIRACAPELYTDDMMKQMERQKKSRRLSKDQDTRASIEEFFKKKSSVDAETEFPEPGQLSEKSPESITARFGSNEQARNFAKWATTGTNKVVNAMRNCFGSCAVTIIPTMRLKKMPPFKSNAASFTDPQSCTGVPTQLFRDTQNALFSRFPGHPCSVPMMGQTALLGAPPAASQVPQITPSASQAALPNHGSFFPSNTTGHPTMPQNKPRGIFGRCWAFISEIGAGIGRGMKRVNKAVCSFFAWISH